MLNTIGRYTIKKRLGQGGMAAVYLAHDPNFDTDVAIKVLPRQLSHHADPQQEAAAIARFRREAKTIASLREHPAIVSVYDYGTQDDQPYLVMRHLRGGSLADRLDGGPMAPVEVVKIIERLASALDAAHKRGITHRDLKPANVLFDEDDNAYLSDFGIAKLAKSNATYTGSAIIGTPTYMSPEQARGNVPIDGRSDIYALGVLLYEMLAGIPPFSADTAMGVALQHISDPAPDIRALRADLPLGFTKLLNTALAKSPDDRFDTAGDFAAVLAAATLQVTAPSTVILPKSDVTAAILAATNNKPPKRKPIAAASVQTPAPATIMMPATAAKVAPAATPTPVVARSEQSRSRFPMWLVPLVVTLGVLIGFFIWRGQNEPTPVLVVPTQDVVALIADTSTETPSAAVGGIITATATATTEIIPTATVTASNTPLPTATATATRLPTVTPTATQVPAVVPVATAVPSPTPTLPPDATATPTATAEPPTVTATHTATPTQAPAATATPTSTPATTATPTSTPAATATSTLAATATATSTSAATNTPTATSASPSTPTSTPTLVSADAVINQFTSSVFSAELGNVLTLSWDVSGVDSMRLTRNVEGRLSSDIVAAQGTQAVTILESDLDTSTLIFELQTIDNGTSSQLIINLACPYQWFFSPDSAVTSTKCPSQPLISAGSTQRFQNGAMIWVAQLDQIWVYLVNGSSQKFTDDWQEDMQEDSCPNNNTALKPTRGFGLVWCNNTAIQAALGSPIAGAGSYTTVWQRTRPVISGTQYLRMRNGNVLIIPNGSAAWSELTNVDGFASNGFR